MKKRNKLTSLAVISTLLTLTIAGSVQAAPKNNRFSGQDRFQTSIAIARQEFQGQQVQNVVIASAYSFPDALAASTLAAKQKAPIVLVGSGMRDSEASLSFIKNHLTAGGTVTIIGGAGVINKNIEKWLLNAGYVVTRMGGTDRFGTDAIIVNNLNVDPGTPVVIASGYDFPDALGVASIAASKGWPILLSGPNQLPQAVQSFIEKDQPSNVYIVGGKGVLHDSIETAIKTADLSTQITRFGGQDRFETLSQILTSFYPNPTQIYLANGLDFADALSGSTLAAQNNAPILLINPKSGQLPSSIKDYLITLRNTGCTPQVNVLGGTAGVPDWVVTRVNEILGGSATPPAPGAASFTVNNPSPTGFTVSMNPALNGLTASNFKIVDNSSNVITTASASTTDNGATYAINASLNAGQTYTVTITDAGGNTLGTPQTAAVPSASSTQVAGIVVTGSDNATSVVNGGTLQMNAVITPSDATNQNITWSVTPDSAATISSTGLLTGTGTGTVTVTAAANDGSNVTGTLQITVTAAPEPAAATVLNASTLDSTHIVLTMSSALTGSLGDPAAFTISGAASNPTVSSVAVSDTTVTLTLNSPIVNSDSSVTVSYSKTGTNDLTTGTPVENFTGQSVTNNVQ